MILSSPFLMSLLRKKKRKKMGTKKVITDILTDNGRYSIKRVYSAVVLTYAMLFATYIVVSDYLLKEEINRYAIEVLELMILFTGGLIGMDEFKKKLDTKTTKKQGTDE